MLVTTVGKCSHRCRLTTLEFQQKDDDSIKRLSEEVSPMNACTYCFHEFRLSNAMAQMIGKFDMVIQFHSCGQRVVYKREEATRKSPPTTDSGAA